MKRITIAAALALASISAYAQDPSTIAGFSRMPPRVQAQVMADYQAEQKAAQQAKADSAASRAAGAKDRVDTSKMVETNAQGVDCRFAHCHDTVQINRYISYDHGEHWVGSGTEYRNAN